MSTLHFGTVCEKLGITTFDQLLENYSDYLADAVEFAEGDDEKEKVTDKIVNDLSCIYFRTFVKIVNAYMLNNLEIEFLAFEVSDDDVIVTAQYSFEQSLKRILACNNGIGLDQYADIDEYLAQEKKTAEQACKDLMYGAAVNYSAVYGGTPLSKQFESALESALKYRNY